MNGELHTNHPNEHTSTGLMLWRVTNSWQRTIRAALAPFDLTHVQFVLLAVLTAADRDRPFTQRDLADRAATDPMMTSQVLRALEAKRLVERLPHPSDGRAKALAPTRAGVELVNRANTAVEEADRRYFAALGKAEPGFTRALNLLDHAERES